jgi:hypothetical protein
LFDVVPEQKLCVAGARDGGWAAGGAAGMEIPKCMRRDALLCAALRCAVL